jgi:glutamate-ammonia-ligase adenylyltransferase
MNPLAARFAEGLTRGAADRALLAEAGEADPAAAAAAFERAIARPELAAVPGSWIPALLASARPGFGASSLDAIAAGRVNGNLTPLDLNRTPTLPKLVGDSNFLARLLERRPAWLDTIEGAMPPPPEAKRPDPEWRAIHRSKYRGLLRVAARDLAGRAFRESLVELSDLADGCLDAALSCAAAESGHAAPALFALGKLGGRELNFSSDVDLLFLLDSGTAGGDPAPVGIQEATTLVQCFKRGLETPGEEGFGYRVDLDLRPEGRAGVLANPIDAALDYYETFGAEWERQMLIRLRPVAGATAALERFPQAIAPFVYRRSIDPGVMGSVRAMKQRIEDERLRAGRDLEVDLKEGPGGIRDVEFLVQSLQLFHAGHHAVLRTGNVCDALDGFASLGLLPGPVTASLQDAYLWLRRVEHALQLVEERQTQTFPRDPVEQTALARRVGYDDPQAKNARNQLLDDWTRVRTEVRAHFDALVLGTGD